VREEWLNQLAKPPGERIEAPFRLDPSQLDKKVERSDKNTHISKR